jgi:hypothetical protein
MQAVLHPSLREMALVKLMINAIEIPQSRIPSGWTLTSIREKFFELIQTHVWKMIKMLAKTVAVSLVARLPPLGNDSGGELVKRRKLDNNNFRRTKTMSMLRALTGGGSESIEEQNDPGYTERDPAKIVENEMKTYFAIRESNFPETDDTIRWWHGQRSKLPCLSQVAGSLLACKPGSGGLECDFGGIGDILTGKRATLSSGFVEATMMLKLNKDYVSSNSSDIVKLENSDWREYIPTRPVQEAVNEDDSTNDVEMGDPAIMDDEELV